MKRNLLLVFIGLLVAPASSVADGVPSRALPVVAQSEAGSSSTTDKAVQSTRSATRVAVSDSAAVAQNYTPVTDAEKTRVAGSTSAVSRAVITNSAVSATTTTPRQNVTTISRSATTSRALAGQGSAPQSAREKLEATVSNVGMSSRASESSLNNSTALRRAGVTVRPTLAEVGGRATIAGTNRQTGSNLDYTSGAKNRSVTSRAATKAVTAESIAEAKNQLEQTAALNKSCQEQYNECMDQFCAVIDANQKRCSCSNNLSRYTKVEDAVKDANTKLNEVAQRIRYVGLSADEIRAILNATEAEEALTGTKDTTESRSMLEAIEDMIKDPTAYSSYSADTYSGLDLDLNFSSDISDIFSLDFLNTNTGSFSNLRGTDLYNAAKKRCNTIITQCKEVGATAQQITGNYDLAIDKDCIAYEQGLTKMNETLVSNVRSANLMLQKARLAVLQNKNQYDAKGCIAALDSCMKDDMVCGADYEKCLDPTKIYIDENGEVVLGKDVTKIRDFMAEYNNALITPELLSKADLMSITEWQCATTAQTSATAGNNGACNVKYLLSKIGTGAKITDGGLCRPVLDKCQRYTYDNNGNYKQYNDVVVTYIQRAMVNIKAAQEKIISDYASSCMIDIAACYNQQYTQVNTWTTSASADSVRKVLRGACRNVALTCAYAVFDEDDDSCPTTSTTGTTPADTCIDSISELFYQSLLCPDNSTYQKQQGAVSENETKEGMVNEYCKCIAGYVSVDGECRTQCGKGAKHNTYGNCVCIDTANTTMNKDGDCVCKDENATLSESGQCGCKDGYTNSSGKCVSNQ